MKMIEPEADAAPRNPLPPKGANKIWVFVTLAFVILIAAWTALIVIAVKNQPEVIEIQKG